MSHILVVTNSDFNPVLCNPVPKNGVKTGGKWVDCSYMQSGSVIKSGKRQPCGFSSDFTSYKDYYVNFRDFGFGGVVWYLVPWDPQVDPGLKSNIPPPLPTPSPTGANFEA